MPLLSTLVGALVLLTRAAVATDPDVVLSGICPTHDAACQVNPDADEPSDVLPMLQVRSKVRTMASSEKNQASESAHEGLRKHDAGSATGSGGAAANGGVLAAQRRPADPVGAGGGHVEPAASGSDLNGPRSLDGVDPLASQFLLAKEFRDPNTTWDTVGKLVFLKSLTTFWVVLCVLVHIAPRISGRCRGRNREQKRAGAMPLVDGGSEEVNVGPKPPYPWDRRVAELFEDHARQTPEALALVVPREVNKKHVQDRFTLTYAELDAAAEEVAQALLSLGISRGSVVALVLPRSVAQVVAVYGVLKAGAAFLPIDAEAPGARKQFFFTDSVAACVIATRGDVATSTLAAEASISFIELPTDGSLGGLEVQAASGCAASPRVRPDLSDTALLFYTSGTAGKPKGIVYDHQQLLHGVRSFVEQNEVGPGTVGFLKASYFWAVVEWELFPVLSSGGTLVVASPQGHKIPSYLAEVIFDEKISVLMITPQVLDLVLDVHEATRSTRSIASLRHITTVGEPLPTALANRVARMQSLDCKVHNFYGASESSCTVYTIPDEGVDVKMFPMNVPAGLPQPHASVYVMDVEEVEGDVPVFTRVSTGTRGEICFGGISAAGYWKNEELTRTKWVETREFGRLYRTGDLGQWRGGLLEVVGRTDRQVKIQGVRIEPEEVEAVLKTFTTPAPLGSEVPSFAVADLEKQRPSCRGPRLLEQVSVVASAEPAELVAFVSRLQALKGGAEPWAELVTHAALRAHCQASLAPAYVPKHYVILPDGLPLLPNGKPDLAKLKELATEHADSAVEAVRDSLGQMRSMSKRALFETNVIHRCYAFWMVGVLINHFNRCVDFVDALAVPRPYCTALAMKHVPPWIEVLLRSFGNDQVLYGFTMAGAYQDSRPGLDRKKRIGFGFKDLFLFFVYLMLALPFPQMFHHVFGQLAWPHAWAGNPTPNNDWDWSYMRVNSNISEHRWYLMMLIQARLYLFICEKLNDRLDCMPHWLQSLLVILPCCIPSCFLEKGNYGLDFCQPNSQAPVALQYMLSWAFRSFGTGCPMFLGWMHFYVAVYVICYHYLRPAATLASRTVPKGPTWGAAALGASLMIGVLMCLYHYPNNVPETQTGIKRLCVELGANFLQPVLLVLGMTQVPLDLKWWGNTTLGCYAFHFYFKDQMCVAIQAAGRALAWDPTGILLFIAIVGACMMFSSVLGPVSHSLLVSPILIRWPSSSMCSKRAMN